MICTKWSREKARLLARNTNSITEQATAAKTLDGEEGGGWGHATGDSPGGDGKLRRDLSWRGRVPHNYDIFVFSLSGLMGLQILCSILRDVFYLPIFMV
ncbi:hypothetical protein GDO81_030219 [Engystomops pustulosus]|uniref:Uncharacterized protein n=1 Tax=Engystomops pustulosus TaxID=76066 RepID=A0AAV6Z4J6_ENGPU|nr:hypothetical protein GDO81_030219 [Engystomops pustulosus]